MSNCTPPLPSLCCERELFFFPFSRFFMHMRERERERVTERKTNSRDSMPLISSQCCLSVLTMKTISRYTRVDVGKAITLLSKELFLIISVSTERNLSSPAYLHRTGLASSVTLQLFPSRRKRIECCWFMQMTTSFTSKRKYSIHRSLGSWPTTRFTLAWTFPLVE